MTSFSVFPWVLLAGVFVSSPMLLRAQAPFVFQQVSVEPGTRQTFQIPVMSDQDTTFLPVVVVHGRRPGPVLGITAGVHGYEYAPILAGQLLLPRLDPDSLTGTVLLVPLANVPAFLGRSPYLNPLDRKNLNRVFPGNPDGSITERMADLITRLVIARADFFLDMHAGDAPEDLRPYVGYYTSPRLPDASAQGERMAQAMGFDHLVQFRVAPERLDEPSQYCSQEAFHRKIPAIDIECGKLGTTSSTELKRIVEGVMGLLRALEMWPGTPQQTPGQLMIRERYSVDSVHDGIFYPLKQSGEYVQEGMRVGYITDFFGQRLTEVHANATGVILYILGTPPVRQGETIVRIGVPDTRTPDR
ncbi:hypothetical protein SAMN05421823_1205 [Catalinimonas alkaloidigena]|uniref:Succinylglutamate desuccinylase/Aspartoacylase catalytic domain-containing protein n=1 Tax=Catalinimonas alkaloidigena TaxID=1075417 RepID=A0A1G9VDY5_9BACT|nr:M14 family metallopeptidase [Catalinimonas alkaloidigena]SDM70300.1 hypothetical protein SAMN05421823_1205 [Catalinimonas alkaloidigena]